MPRIPVLDVYLDEVHRIRATRAGTAETSFYPAIAQMLNHAGATLRPRVFCLHHPSGDSGIPDFGLFEQAQFKRDEDPVWTQTVTPERGVVEAKSASHSISALLASKQVRQQYLPTYGLVLTTNLWQFRLVNAKSIIIETFDLAADEAAFWKLAAGSRPDTLRERFEAFLVRCLLTKAPLRRPADVAFFLASYAREALGRLSERPKLSGLPGLRKGMEDALGVRFEARDGERLFRSTLVQTLFYGLFSAWVVHARAGKTGFDWRVSQWSLHVPVMRLLFGQIATPEALGPIGVVPLLDAAGAAMERIERDAFFTAFSDERAVQYFYEPFLEYYDPELRRQLGVWYTPSEIVHYQVERVDRLLRSELGVSDGFADPNVWVLDPCCGTGSYIVAVLDRIRRTLDDRGMGDLAAEELKKAATTRVVGFEIMTAPFVISHWQVAERLHDAPLQEGERAAVYLTNALTGWNESDAGPPIPGYEALVEERGAATSVKRDRPVLVILGNPPYYGYAGLSPKEEGGLVEPYKVGLRAKWGIRKSSLDDPYVRFYRIAERRIAEKTGLGIISYITNWSWLFLPSYVVMRERLLSGFDAAWLECMNGDSRETGKLTPDGRPDPSVFSTERNREGIRIGTAISTLVRREGEHERSARVSFRSFWGSEKRSDLFASLSDGQFEERYEPIKPEAAIKYVLRPRVHRASYGTWASVETLLRTPPMPGLLEKRGGGLIDLDRKNLEARMRAYLDPKLSFEQAHAANRALGANRARYDAKATRMRLLQEEGYKPKNIVRYCLFGFDMRWAYVTGVRPTWNEPRPQLIHVLPEARGFLHLRPQRIADPEGFPAYWTSGLADDHALHKDAFLVPVVENLSGAPRPNLSAAAVAYLGGLDLSPNPETAEMLLHHVLATLYSPLYVSENEGGLRQGWPRIPLPRDPKVLQASADLGKQLAMLLNPDIPVPGVSGGAPRPELAPIAVPSTLPEKKRDWALSGWGNRTNAGVTMPLRGRVSLRDYSNAEETVRAHARILGAQAFDIGMSEASYWRCVPESVWECRIGGYQVLKKWLSYRDYSIIGRPLTGDEVGNFQQSARRISTILLLGPALDASYQHCMQADG
jgi:hypothetical protein